MRLGSTVSATHTNVWKGLLKGFIWCRWYKTPLRGVHYPYFQYFFPRNWERKKTRECRYRVPILAPPWYRGHRTRHIWPPPLHPPVFHCFFLFFCLFVLYSFTSTGSSTPSKSPSVVLMQVLICNFIESYSLQKKTNYILCFKLVICTVANTRKNRERMKTCFSTK